MRLKHRWYRFSYKLAKRIAVREKHWDVNDTSLNTLLKFFPIIAPMLENTKAWRKVHIHTQWRTIDGFVVHLQVATRIIHAKGDILEPKQLIQQPTSVRLYDFFMTENRLPLTLLEVVRVLEPAMHEFLNALKDVDSQDEFRARYYRRRYGHLLEAMFYFVQTILDLATWE